MMADIKCSTSRTNKQSIKVIIEPLRFIYMLLFALLRGSARPPLERFFPPLKSLAPPNLTKLGLEVGSGSGG